MNKDLSTLEWKEVQDWLKANGMEKYIHNFESYGVNGYDLCYLANEDFAEMSITNFHDKNIILKNIRMMTLDELKLNMQYEGKRITVQLDFEPSFTAEMLSMSLCDLFHIQSKIYLCTSDGEILMPNIKIVELILLNPRKYKQLKILTERDNYSPVSNSSFYMGSNAYGAGNQMKSIAELSTVNQSKLIDNNISNTDYRVKGLKDNYALYDQQYQQPKKYDKKDIEKEYMVYKETKQPNMGNVPNDNMTSINDSKTKSEQYRSYKEKDKDNVRPYTPIELQRYNISNTKEQQGSYYNAHNNNLNDSKGNLTGKLNEEQYNNNYNNNINSNMYYNDDKTKVNLNNVFKYPMSMPIMDNNPNDQQQYRNYNVNNNDIQQRNFKEDSRKYASEKRSYRIDQNPNDSELIRSSNKYSNFNNEKQVNEEQYIGKANEGMPSQNMYDTKARMRVAPMKMKSGI